MVFVLEQPKGMKTGLFINVIILVISWVYVYVRLIKENALSLYSLSYINYNVIKLFRNFRKVTTSQCLGRGLCGVP